MIWKHKHCSNICKVHKKWFVRYTYGQLTALTCAPCVEYLYTEAGEEVDDILGQQNTATDDPSTTVKAERTSELVIDERVGDLERERFWCGSDSTARWEETHTLLAAVLSFIRTIWHIQAHTYLHHTRARTHARTHAHRHTHTHISIYIYIYIYIYIHTSTIAIGENATRCSSTRKSNWIIGLKYVINFDNDWLYIPFVGRLVSFEADSLRPSKDGLLQRILFRHVRQDSISDLAQERRRHNYGRRPHLFHGLHQQKRLSTCKISPVQLLLLLSICYFLFCPLAQSRSFEN